MIVAKNAKAFVPIKMTVTFMADVYFNVRKLKGKAHKEYVAFVDIMGTRTHMKKSVYESANFGSISF